MASAFLVVGAALGALFDLKTRKIPNWLTAILFLLAVFLATLRIGNLLPTMESAALVAGLFSIGASLGKLGWGDVKFGAALAAFGGPWWGIVFFLMTALAGGCLAVLILFFGPARVRFGGSLEQALAALKENAHQTMPYGVALAAGALGTLLLFPHLHLGGVI